MFKQKTVADVLLPLTKICDSLDAIVSERLQNASQKEQEADVLKGEATVDRNEAEKARTVLKRISALMEDEE